MKVRVGILILNRVIDEKDLKDIVNRNNEELEQANKRLIALIEGLTTRIATLETWKATGATNNSNYVCNNNTTYDGKNSKILTVADGLVTGIET